MLSMKGLNDSIEDRTRDSTKAHEIPSYSKYSAAGRIPLTASCVEFAAQFCEHESAKCKLNRKTIYHKPLQSEKINVEGDDIAWI